MSTKTKSTGLGRTVGQTAEALVRKTNRWRDGLNPLRQLTLSRAVGLFEAKSRGELSDLMWTYFSIEETDPDLMALIERRTSAIKQLDHNSIVAENLITSQELARMADEQLAAHTKFYEGIGNLTDLFEHLALASFRGFAFAQPQRGSSEVSFTEPDHIELLDPWLFARDGSFGPFYWNPEAKSTIQKTDENKIDPSSVLLREVRRPINRFALLKFIRSNLSEKDWDAFIEMYGLGKGVIIGPPNMSETEKSEFAAAADKLDAGGALPNGSDVKYPSEVRGNQPFKPRLDHLTEKLILAGTGGMLTMLSAPGSGTLAGGAHQEAFEIIARSEAKVISQIIQRQLDKRFFAEKFPGQPVLVYFELAAKEEQDIGAVIDHTAKLSSAGFQIDIKDLEERTGYKLALKPQAPAAPQGIGLALNSAAASDPADAAAKRRQQILDDVLGEIEKAGADAKTEQEFLAAAEKIIAGMPARLPELSAADALALGDQMLGAALGGIEQDGAKVLNRWVTINGRAVEVDEDGEPKLRETKVNASAKAFSMLGIKPGNVFADYGALQQKHPEYFKNSRDVQKHVDWVFESPTHVRKGNRDDHRLLIRDDEGAGKLVAVEIELKGGKYRVRSAYTMTEAQREKFKVKNSASRDAIPGALVCKSGKPETSSRLLGMLCNMLPADLYQTYYPDQGESQREGAKP